MVVINGICYIIGASFNAEQISIPHGSDDYIIAADGGYDLLKKHNIEPDIIVGDFDSVSSTVNHNFTIKYPAEKDDTDSFLAYKLGYEKGYRKFVVYGGTGGRMDHTIANIQMLCHMAKNNARGFLVGNSTVITAIYNSKINFPKNNVGKFGVFAFGRNAEGVNIIGAKYSLEDAVISPEYPIGVSNEFIGRNSEISVIDGTLVLVFYETEKEFLRKINIYTEDLL